MGDWLRHARKRRQARRYERHVRRMLASIERNNRWADAWHR